MRNKIRKLVVHSFFTEYQRQLIADALMEYTDYPDDVCAEHFGEDWYERQQREADEIISVVM